MPFPENAAKQFKRLGLALMIIGILIGWINAGFDKIEILWELFIAGVVVYLLALAWYKKIS